MGSDRLSRRRLAHFTFLKGELQQARRLSMSGLITVFAQALARARGRPGNHDMLSGLPITNLAFVCGLSAALFLPELKIECRLGVVRALAVNLQGVSGDLHVARHDLACRYSVVLMREWICMSVPTNCLVHVTCVALGLWHLSRFGERRVQCHSRV